LGDYPQKHEAIVEWDLRRDYDQNDTRGVCKKSVVLEIYL
jgi:hypothetical protein